MFTNKEKITIYHKNEDKTFSRYSVGPVFLMATKKHFVIKNAIVGSSDIIKVYIPKANIKNTVINTDDILISDDIAFEIDNSSEASISNSIKELKRQMGGKYSTIKMVDEKFYGSEDMQHLYIEAGV